MKSYLCKKEQDHRKMLVPQKKVHTVVSSIRICFCSYGKKSLFIPPTHIFLAGKIFPKFFGPSNIVKKVVYILIWKLNKLNF